MSLVTTTAAPTSWLRTTIGAYAPLRPLSQFNTFFGADLVDEYCETIGGLITDRCEHVPQIGEEIVEKGYRFRIQRADARQVQLLTVERA